MSYEFHSETYRGYKIRIVQDDHAESPREWDNLGEMVFKKQRNYRLGDTESGDVFADLVELANPFFDIRERLSGVSFEEEFPYHEDIPDDVVAAMLRWIDANYVILGLSFHDYGYNNSIGHHPITQFDDNTDGYIVASHQKVEKWFEGCSGSWDQKLFTAREALVGEVETYESYVNGNVAYYVVEDAEGESIDSCSGFYPDEEDDWSYPISEAKSHIDHHLKHEEELALQLCQNI